MKFPIINIYVHFFFSCSRKLTTFAHILNKKSMSFFCFELHCSHFKIWLGLLGWGGATCEASVKFISCGNDLRGYVSSNLTAYDKLWEDVG